MTHRPKAAVKRSDVKQSENVFLIPGQKQQLHCDVFYGPPGIDASTQLARYLLMTCLCRIESESGPLAPNRRLLLMLTAVNSLTV